jgi:hypothetical protein
LICRQNWPTSSLIHVQSAKQSRNSKHAANCNVKSLNHYLRYKYVKIEVKHDRCQLIN